MQRTPIHRLFDELDELHYLLQSHFIHTTHFIERQSLYLFQLFITESWAEVWSWLNEWLSRNVRDTQRSDKWKWKSAWSVLVRHRAPCYWSYTVWTVKERWTLFFMWRSDADDKEYGLTQSCSVELRWVGDCEGHIIGFTSSSSSSKHSVDGRDHSHQGTHHHL